ncbi:MAG: hypothetical protein Q8872_02885 [Candidatus Phytoplasma australasiaticum]|nr:hypothetical protein [Candidatus Phytoplasma australasiaticum]
MFLYDNCRHFLGGVFDVHGGAKVAELVAQKLENNILDEVVKAGYLQVDVLLYERTMAET